MPVKKLQFRKPASHAELTNELLDEWSKPDPRRKEPVILEEAAQGKLAHVYVVWSKWADLDQVERSEIIMAAAEKKLEPEVLVNITLAMGLTPAEAQRMHIRY